MSVTAPQATSCNVSHLSLLLMAGGVEKRKWVLEKTPSENLIFGLRAGEEVRATRALMVGDFRRELSGEDAGDGVVVVLEARVDSATNQVEFDGFVGREI